MTGINWAQDPAAVAQQLCGMSAVRYFPDGRVYQALITEATGWREKEGKNKEKFWRPPGEVVLWPYRSGHFTHIGAHEYSKSGFVGIHKAVEEDEEYGPLKFTAWCGMKELEGRQVRQNRGTGLLIVETPGLEDARLAPVDVLDQEDHPPNRVAHWRLEYQSPHTKK